MKQKIILITAGRGPVECAWVVAQVTKKILAEAKAFGINGTVLSREQGEQKNTLRSASILFQGENLISFLDGWIGTIQWTEKSPYRKFNKRKNWFIGIYEMDPQKEGFDDVKESDITYETFRAGGPGGQHVNKVETAVRATYKKTNISAVARDSKSQLQNKKEARKKLNVLLQKSAFDAIKLTEKITWFKHTALERGNPIRTFEKGNFKPNHKPKKYREQRKKHNKKAQLTN